MREAALAALATDPSRGLDDQTQRELIEASGQGLQSIEVELTGLRADLGFAEARIEESMARNASSRTSLEYARASLLEADPFETATRLDEVQFQLESLYAVTVRTSGLNLVNFL
jgi:flagellar hook-associated protein 3 FlgL